MDTFPDPEDDGLERPLDQSDSNRAAKPPEEPASQDKQDSLPDPVEDVHDPLEVALHRILHLGSTATRHPETLPPPTYLQELQRIADTHGLHARLVAALQYAAQLQPDMSLQDAYLDPHLLKGNFLQWEMHVCAAGTPMVRDDVYPEYTPVTSLNSRDDLGSLRIETPDGSHDELYIHTLSATVTARLSPKGRISKLYAHVEINAPPISTDSSESSPHKTPDNPFLGAVVFDISSSGQVEQLYIEGTRVLTSMQHPTNRGKIYVVAAQEALNDVLDALEATLRLHEDLREFTDGPFPPLNP